MNTPLARIDVIRARRKLRRHRARLVVTLAFCALPFAVAYLGDIELFVERRLPRPNSLCASARYARTSPASSYRVFAVDGGYLYVGKNGTVVDGDVWRDNDHVFAKCGGFRD